MSRRRLRNAPVWAIVATIAVVAAGCGGGGSDVGDVTDTVEGVFTSADPSVCTELMTARYLAQTQFISGSAAVAACKQNQARNAGDSVKVSNVELSGDAATADVAVRGGSLNNQTVSVSLRNEDGEWRLDHIEGFPSFNRTALNAAIATSYGSGRPGRCVQRRLSRLSDAAIQSLYLSGDRTRFAALIEDCFRPS
jgi:hypothetical protein